MNWFSYYCVVDLQRFMCTAKCTVIQMYSFSDFFPFVYVCTHSVLSDSLRPHYRLLKDTEYSSLCNTVGPCCLFIFYIVVCICSKSRFLSLYPIYWIRIIANERLESAFLISFSSNFSISLNLKTMDTGCRLLCPLHSQDTRSSEILSASSQLGKSGTLNLVTGVI